LAPSDPSAPLHEVHPISAPGTVAERRATEESAVEASAGTRTAGLGWGTARGWQLVVSLGVAVGFVWLLQRGALPLVPPRGALAEVRWWTVAAYLVLWSGVHFVRAARWQFLLRGFAQVPFGRVLGASFVGFLAIQVLPLRAGEVVRPLLVRQRGQVSAWAALGTIAAERIVDGLVLSALLLAALLFSQPLTPLPRHLGDLPIDVALIPKAAYLALVVFTGASIAMAIAYWRRAWTRRLVQVLINPWAPRAGSWFVARLEQLSDGFGFLARARDAVPFVGATVAYWVINALGTELLAWGVGLVDFTGARAGVLTGVLALGILVPNAPGFFGAYQFSLYGALALFYPEPTVRGSGAVLVLLMYLCQAAVTLVFAVFAWLLGGRSWRSISAGKSGPWGVDSASPPSSPLD
jgi:glycosyltransferase 2 family protein